MRKPQRQPSLATLTEADRQQLADWLRRDPYTVVRDRVNQPRPEGFGLSISIKPLQTFFAKVAFLDLINSRLPDDKKLTLTEFEALAHGEMLLASPGSSIPSDEKSAAAHDAILDTTHDLATSGDNTPAQLLALQRLADFPARAALRAQKFAHQQDMDAFRQHIATERLELAKQNFAFRQKQHEDRLAFAREKLSLLKSQPSASPNSDHLGPYASTEEELSERIRKQQGVPKEEWDRRLARNREHFNQHYHPDGTLKQPLTTSTHELHQP